MEAEATVKVRVRDEYEYIMVEYVRAYEYIWCRAYLYEYIRQQSTYLYSVRL